MAETLTMIVLLVCALILLVLTIVARKEERRRQGIFRDVISEHRELLENQKQFKAITSVRVMLRDGNVLTLSKAKAYRRSFDEFEVIDEDSQVIARFPYDEVKGFIIAREGDEE